METGPLRLQLELDGRTAWEQVVSPTGMGREHKVRLYAQVPLAAGTYQARLLLFDPPDVTQPVVLYAAPLQITVGQVLRLAYEDQVLGGDAQAGEALYQDASPGRTASCRICHSLAPGQDLVGPSLAGVASRAAARVPGLGAADYLRQSILQPDAYVVPGFPAGQMTPDLGEHLNPQQVEDLVAFLMTLK